MIVDVVIPAYNEQESVGLVVKDIPKEYVRHIVVVSNASTDLTYQRAKEAGAVALMEKNKGYGSACLCGLKWLSMQHPQPEVVVFLDADYSDHPEELPKLLAPIEKGEAELVIGSRAIGNREKGSMTPQQVFGNRLATFLMRLFFKSRFTDLGPFRAITWQALDKIKMRDPDFGWTVEMQVKALKRGIRYTEIPVTYRKRVGVSKVSGTLRGTVLAGYKIILTIFKYLRS